jgi:hypothetical protein
MLIFISSNKYPTTYLFHVVFQTLLLLPIWIDHAKPGAIQCTRYDFTFYYNSEDILCNEKVLQSVQIFKIGKLVEISVLYPFRPLIFIRFVP